MRFVIVLLMLTGLFLVQPSAPSAQEKAVLESVTYERQQDGTEIVKFRLNGPHIQKTFMLIGEKPRLVIDFPGTRYRGKSRFTPEDGVLIKGIRIGIHEKPQMKTRVVIDLLRNHPVRWQQDFYVHNNQLVITVNPDKSSQPPEQDEVTVPEPVSAEAPRTTSPERTAAEQPRQQSMEKTDETQGLELADKTQAVPDHSGTGGEEQTAPVRLDGPVLLDVSFDKKSEKGEMILFKLDDFHPPVVSAIEKGTPRIVCDFYNMRIAGDISENITVDGDFINQVRVGRHENPGKVRAVLDLVPGRDYGLQQVYFNEDNLFVLIVNILAVDSNADNPQ